MIAYLKGTILLKKPGQVVLDVGGVGYRVLIPLSTYYELNEEGSSAAFRIYTQVREDTLALFGFLTEVEEVLFEKLISVAGVGPSLALKVLSGLEPRELVDAIRHGDLRRLCSIPGVGRKIAERLILELKEKMPEILTLAGGTSEVDEMGPSEPTLRDDLLSALMNLGYQRNQADRAVSQVLRDDSAVTFETALKEILHLFSK